MPTKKPGSRGTGGKKPGGLQATGAESVAFRAHRRP